MKQYSILLAVLVLTASLLTGCGCTRRGAETDTQSSSQMTILPTNIPETTAPVMPSTEPATTAPTQMPSESETAGSEHGGSSDSMTGETDGARSGMK